MLRGTARAERVEVSVDSDPFRPAQGTDDWAFPIDTDQWTFGWHLVRIRARKGGAEQSMHISLYTLNGYEPPPDPIVVPAPGPPQPAPTEGLVAHWAFTGGEPIDLSGNAFDGTLYGAPQFAQNVLVLDHLDDKVFVPDQSSPPPAAIGALTEGTITIRFRYNDLKHDGTGESMPLLYYGANDATMAQSGWDCVTVYLSHGEMHNPLRRQVYFTVLSGQTIVLCFDTKVSLSPDRWYDYAVVISERDGHKAYLDGQRLTLNYNAGTQPTTHAFFHTPQSVDMLALGYGYFAFFSNWNHFDGAIDDVRIYDRPLKASEIAAVAGES